MALCSRSIPMRKRECIFNVVKAENEAKYWLEPNIELAENFGFNTKELSFIEKILKDYGDDFKIKFARHTGKRLDDK